MKRGFRNYLGSDEREAGYNLSWGSIFAGVVTFIALFMTLSMIGSAIGFGMVEPTSNNPLDGVDSLGGENNTGKKGTAEMEGVPGMYKVPANKNLPTTDWDWTIDPMGLRFACRKITSRYDLPIVISENGLGAFDKLEDGQIHDSYRIEYLRNHIEELKKACDDGCRILAYCTWSYTDLLSWLNGYQKRYGFVYVDRDEDENSGTLKRIPKDSYYWYKKVIETNGEEL